jgi:hypothetical protein
MLDNFLDCILALHTSHFVAILYTLSTLFLLPSDTLLQKRKKEDVKWEFVFLVGSLGMVVVVVGLWMVVGVVYYGFGPRGEGGGWWTRVEVSW